MVNWDIFIWFAASSVLLSSVAAVLSAVNSSRLPSRKLSVFFSASSVIVLAAFIAGLWISLGRPPLRTMGETRLWYSFFAFISGLFTYMRWKYRWILSFSTVLATVFILINLLKPEIHDQSLMPALQSPWFIPHVTVYMFSYSLLGCAFLIAVVTLFGKNRSISDPLAPADTLIYIGAAFLTFGMLSGSLWAKEAWGHYWNWDPKETWALITWLSYMLYIHLRLFGHGGTAENKLSVKVLCILLVFCFACLQMCWWGVNYLPSAQDSVHVYNR